MNRRQFLIGAAVAAAIRPALPERALYLPARTLEADIAGDFLTENLRFKCIERYSSALELREVLVEIQQHGPRQSQVQPERFRDSSAWYLKTEHSNGLKTFKRRVKHTVLDDPLNGHDLSELSLKRLRKQIGGTGVLDALSEGAGVDGLEGVTASWQTSATTNAAGDGAVEGGSRHRGRDGIPIPQRGRSQF